MKNVTLGVLLGGSIGYWGSQVFIWYLHVSENGGSRYEPNWAGSSMIALLAGASTGGLLGMKIDEANQDPP